MPVYEFRCEITDDRLDVEIPAVVAPPIGSFRPCPCGVESEVHDMQRLVSPGAHMAPVPGTPTNRIGMAIEDRADLARKRRAEWK